MEDTENGEGHEGAALFASKRHQNLQLDIQSDQTRATGQQKTNTQAQDVDEMDIDSSNKDGEQDSNL